MAGNQTYSIKLRLDIDDSQLSNVEKRLRNMRATARVGGRGGVVTGTRGGYDASTVLSRSPAVQELQKRGIFNLLGYIRGRQTIAGDWKKFSLGFLPNLTSAHGLLANVSQFAGLIGSIGSLLGKSIPALSGAMTLLKGGINVALGVNAYRIARGLLPVKFGYNLLNNESLGNAASQLMQMRMAQQGLGANYTTALRSASEIAGTFGFSRQGVLSAINMFTGLSVGGKKMTLGQATRMAETIGKISHVGGVPFERVNINMQQLFGQQTPNARDLRELITAVPLLGKIAQQAMEKQTGQVGNIYDYLKDKLNLMNVLNEFDKQVEASPYLQARGKVTLAKENFFMDIVGSNTANWQKMSEGVTKFFQNMVPIANMVVQAVADLTDTAKIDTATGILFKWAKKIGKFLGIGNTLVNSLAGYNPDTNEYKVKTVRNGQIVEETRMKSSTQSMTSVYQEIAEGERKANEFRKSRLTPTKAQLEAVLGGKITQEEFEKLSAVAPQLYKERQIALGATAIPVYEGSRFSYNTPNYVPKRNWNSSMWSTALGYSSAQVDAIKAQLGAGTLSGIAKAVANFLTPFGGMYYSQRTATQFDLDKSLVEAQVKALRDKVDFPSGGNAGATAELENLAKGARAVIINFNKEIVSMPVNIEQVNDGTDLAMRLENGVRSQIIEGLNIALNNATGAV